MESVEDGWVDEQPHGKAPCQQAGRLGFLGPSEAVCALPGGGNPKWFCWIVCVEDKGEWLHPTPSLRIGMSRRFPEDQP